MLQLRYDVLGCGTLAETLATCEATPPHAIVATLRQVDDNGLVTGQALRAKVGPDVFILVHGPADTRKTPAQRQALSERHGVDMWSETALEPVGIEAVVWNELNRRHRPRAVAPPTLSLLARARAVSSDDVRTFLTKDRPLIPTPPRGEDEEPGWIELLNARPTAENLKRLLWKDIVPRRKAQNG